jgi:hypothetical protein
MLNSNLGIKNFTYYNFNKRRMSDVDTPYDPNNKYDGSYFPNGTPLLSIIYVQDPVVDLVERKAFSLMDALS